MNPKHTILALAVAGLAAGCASTPPANEALTQARSAYTSAQENPHVTRFAPGELARAGTALNRAEQLAGAGHEDEAKHQAYLARQQASIAQHAAMARAADAEIARADDERRRAVMGARLQAAERARAQAEARLQSMQAAASLGGKAGADLQRLHADVPGLKTTTTADSLVLALDGEHLFEDGKAALSAQGQRALQSIARFMQDHPDRGVVIGGFTDAQGHDRTSPGVAQARAQVVKQALEQAGKRSVQIRMVEPQGAASTGR